jgi:hypothetical protein
MNSLATTYIVITEQIEISEKISYKGLTGSWSKYGGGKKSLGVNQFERVYDEWVCQSCGCIEPKEITPYLIEWPKGEYIRVCAICLANKCLILRTRTGDEGW